MEFPEHLKNKIFWDECQHGMWMIPDESVDIVFTDTPYAIGKEYDGHDDDKPPPFKVWQECFRILKPTGSLHTTVGTASMDMWIETLKKAGFAYDHCSVYWNQGRAGGNYEGRWAFAWEPWLHMAKDRYVRLRKRMLSDVFPYTHKKETTHPCERHLGTWKKMLDILDGDIVCDPFMGSARTAIVCIELGKTFVGWEKSINYCKMDQRLIANAKNQGDMFAIKQKPPEMFSMEDVKGKKK